MVSSKRYIIASNFDSVTSQWAKGRPRDVQITYFLYTKTSIWDAI